MLALVTQHLRFFMAITTCLDYLNPFRRFPHRADDYIRTEFRPPIRSVDVCVKWHPKARLSFLDQRRNGRRRVLKSVAFHPDHFHQLPTTHDKICNRLFRIGFHKRRYGTDNPTIVRNQSSIDRICFGNPTYSFCKVANTPSIENCDGDIGCITMGGSI